ncbi:MAG: hypothetical protein HWN79_12425 [Candidatus Lokiarchaeota archaeon]|nr:hypothetical protein [Candidatus Lokiarchaeota archaeon]
MSEEKNSKIEEQINQNKYLVGPGLGLIIIGLSYLVWWLMPFAFDAFFVDMRWAHNWVYAIVILNVGIAWYYKSPLSRIIAVFQAFMLPVTASGSFDTIILTYVSTFIAFLWVLTLLIEKIRGIEFLKERCSLKTRNWINLHTMVFTWILIAHISLVFLIGRLPLENQLLGFGTYAGYLANLPPESLEFATWAFDITLLAWAAIVIYEQIKLGYNYKNKPWPKFGFWWVFVCMGSSLIALLIQELTIGF